MLKRWLQTGRSTMAVVAVWNLFDALLHVAVDMVEPPRIGGNLAALAAVVFAYVTGPRLAALAAVVAGGVVVGINLAFFAVFALAPNAAVWPKSSTVMTCGEFW